jgi:peptide/nickel transport system permease protein
MTETALPALPLTAVRPATAASQFFPRLLRSKMALISSIVLLLVTLAAIFAPFITPNDPADLALIRRLKEPGYVSEEGSQYWLGTDTIGRDVYSRMIYGARISLVVGLSAVLVSGTVGVALGLLAGFYRGWIDDVIMRIADIQLSFPTILLALAIMAVLGPGLDKIIIVLGLTGWVQYGRIVRGEVLSIKEEEFVTAARAIGQRDWRIIFQHILPNIWSPVIVIASFSVASNIVSEASLSFLGVGVPPQIPSWGVMLAEGRQYIGVAEWLTIPPGVAISLTVLAINIVGDWVRDFLDPRLKNIL